MEIGALGGRGAFDPHSGGFRGKTPIRKVLGSKKHLDWFKIDFNSVKKITAQDYKRTKKICGWKYTYTVLKLRVK